MSKSKTTKKKTTAKTRKAAAKTRQKPQATVSPQELCVFAFRLTPEERSDIHTAAGPGKASKFVRTLAVAAARNDEAAVKAILKAAQIQT